MSLLAGHRELCFRTGDGGAELGLVGFRDGEVEAEQSGLLRERLRTRCGSFEAEERAAFGRVRGGMERIGGPLDEERKQAAAVVMKVESFPLKEAAVRTFPRAGCGTVEGEASGAKTGCEIVEVTRMSSPANKARFGEFQQAVVIGSAGLRWIGGDDFEIATGIQFAAAGLAQRKQGVARAAAGMDAAECGGHAGMFFDKRDAAFEIAAAEKNVIEQNGNPLRCPRNRRHDGSACCDGKEGSARELLHLRLYPRM